MASKIFGVLCVLSIATSGMASVATYAHSPNTYHAPAALGTVYQSQPLTYHATSPYFARSVVAPAATVQSYATPFVRTYASAPVAAVSPVVKSYAAAPISAVSPIVRTYAAPVYAKSAVVAQPAATIVKNVAPAQVVAAAPVITKAAVAPAPALLKTDDFDVSPRYDFSYGVHDSLTGDIKNQVESRDGGNVAGSYSVVDADGYKRTVTYTADDLNGFNAVVQREPIVGVAAAVPAPVAVPAGVAASVPVHHVQPIQQNFAFLPAQHGVQQGYLPQLPSVPVQPEPASEPLPVEYPDQQQYPHDQQYPPFPQQPGSINGNNDSNDDSEVVEVRSVADNASQVKPVTENQRDSISPKRTA